MTIEVSDCSVQGGEPAGKGRFNVIIDLFIDVARYLGIELLDNGRHELSKQPLDITKAR